MVHPFLRLSPSSIRRLFWPILLGTILFMVLMNSLNQPLVNSEAPMGIISFELAGSKEAAETILLSWDAFQQKIASFSLGLDFLFIPVYSTAVSLACVWTANIFSKKMVFIGGIGLVLAWLQMGAAILDGIENVALFNILLNNPLPSLASLASWCAMLKFGILFAGITWSLFALAVISLKSVQESTGE